VTEIRRQPSREVAQGVNATKRALETLVSAPHGPFGSRYQVWNPNVLPATK
jgi:hypothetical protein